MGVFDTYPDRYLPRCNSALKTIGTEEVATAEGKFFSAFFFQTGASVSSLMITTGTGYTPTLHTHASCDGAGSWTFAEAPECSAGSAVTAYNMDRTSAITASSATIVSNPTYTTTGTILSRHELPAYTGASEMNHDRVLKASTGYIMEFTPTASARSIISFHFTED